MEKNEEIQMRTRKRSSNKVRSNITLDKKRHEFATKNGINVSRLTNEALKGLEKVTNQCAEWNEVRFGLILTKYGKIEWTRWNSNPGPPPCQDIVENTLKPIKEGEIEDKGNPQNFSTLAEKVSIGNYVTDEKVAAAYLSFCEKTGMDMSVNTARDYLTAIKKLDDVFVPADLSDYSDHHERPMTDKARKGLLKLFKYLETRLYQESFNGISLNVWRANLRITGAMESRMAGRIKDLTDEEIYEARESYRTDDVKFLYTLLCYSGARVKHLIKALSDKRPLIECGPDVVYLDVADLSTGKKYESRFYFPAIIRKDIENFKFVHSEENLVRLISEGTANGRTVNAASIRKWHYTWLLTHGVDSIAADQIQGRVPKGVGASHYANPVLLGEKAYCKIVGDLVDVIPPP